MPDDELPLAAKRVDHRRGVADGGVVEGPPELPAGELVEADDQGSIAAARHDDELLAVDKRRRGHAPGRQLRAIVLRQILLPNYFAVSGLQADQMTNRPQSIDKLAIN